MVGCWFIVLRCTCFARRTKEPVRWATQRPLPRAGSADPRILGDADRRAGTARRARVREGAEEHVHLSAAGRAEQATTVPRREEADRAGERVV